MIPSLYNYINLNRLSDEQIESYCAAIDRNHKEYKFNFNSVNQKEYSLIKNRLTFSNSDNKYISFDSCATNIIDGLFKEYVDDDTLVLTTDSEHDSVIKNIKKCSNTDYVIKNFSLNKEALEKCKHFKKVFVYTIGTYCATGLIVSDIFFEEIKKFLVKNKIDHIFILDAVQEMFLLPRDYSMFDYVIGTAHALIPNYNMGILLSREKFERYPSDGVLSEFDYLLSLLPDLSNFNNLMRMNFQYLTNSNIKMSSGATHLFSIGNEEGTLKPLIDQQDIKKQNRGYYSVNFRGCWFKFGIDTFINLIRRTEKFLELRGYKNE